MTVSRDRRTLFSVVSFWLFSWRYFHTVFFFQNPYLGVIWFVASCCRYCTFHQTAYFSQSFYIHRITCLFHDDLHAPEDSIVRAFTSLSDPSYSFSTLKQWTVDQSHPTSDKVILNRCKIIWWNHSVHQDFLSVFLFQHLARVAKSLYHALTR